MVAQPQLQSTLTCPLCGHQATEIVLLLYGLRRDTEAASRKLLCFLFVRLGAVSAHSRGCRNRCTPKPDQSPKDWVGSTRTSLLAWWLPSATIVAGLFAPIPARTVIWTVALAWMGIACVLNARQCGRTHCRYTGAYYLAMICGRRPRHRPA